jgi:hypothetical protein
MQPRAVLATGLSAALVAAAAYDAVLATTGRTGGGDAHTAAVLIELVGIVVAAACVGRPTRALAPLAPAGAAFLCAFVFTFDPYYAPTLRRYADGSGLWLLWVVAGAALLCGAFTWVAPRGGAAATALLLFFLAPITLLAADGH